MIRLYIPMNLQAQSLVEPSEKQVHYLLHVMRLSNGDKVRLFNGTAGEWEAQIEISGKKKIRFNCLNQTAPQAERKKCILCPALIKKENMDLVLQKATELGVTDIYPLITERTVVRALNNERAQSIIREACEQCERNDVPTLYPPQSLSDFLRTLSPEITLIHLAERASESQLLTPDLTPAFLIGPEGGFTEAENQLIKQVKHCRVIHLGNTILRAETAALAVISAWQFKLF